MEEFTADNITSLSLNWSRHKALNDFKEGVSFRKVPSRAMQAAIMRTVEGGNSDEMMDYISSLQEGDSAVSPDVDDPSGDNSGENGGNSGGKTNPAPNA